MNLVSGWATDINGHPTINETPKFRGSSKSDEGLNNGTDMFNGIVLQDKYTDSHLHAL